MSKRRELNRRVRQLGEIRNIMNSMKNLAFMETRKLARFMDNQHRLVADIEAAASDFLGFYPYFLAAMEPAAHVYVLLGSERGFCGDFNEPLLKKCEAIGQGAAGVTSLLIAVGRRLWSALEGDPRVVAFIDGPGVTEEVAGVLGRIIETIDGLRAQYGGLFVTVLHHGTDESDGVKETRLLPPFRRSTEAPPRFSYPPRINLTADHFFKALVEHYLIAALHEVTYASLMAENHRRVQHMEGATRHLDDAVADLLRKSHILRQEEITEEIEVILLSAASLERPARTGLGRS